MFSLVFLLGSNKKKVPSEERNEIMSEWKYLNQIGSFLSEYDKHIKDFNGKS